MAGLNNKLKDDESVTSIPTSTADIRVGQPCCARFSDDNMWYRASVTKVMGDQVAVSR